MTKAKKRGTSGSNLVSFDAPLHELSALGDSFVNLIYSLAISNALKKPTSKRVSNKILAEALISSGLRSKLGSRVTRHDLADYAEAVIFYAWVRNKITLEECVEILSKRLTHDAFKNENCTQTQSPETDAFVELLKRSAEALQIA